MRYYEQNCHSKKLISKTGIAITQCRLECPRLIWNHNDHSYACIAGRGVRI